MGICEQRDFITSASSYVLWDEIRWGPGCVTYMLGVD
jgi:hypothetical protein